MPVFNNTLIFKNISSSSYCGLFGFLRTSPQWCDTDRCWLMRPRCQGALAMPSVSAAHQQAKRRLEMRKAVFSPSRAVRERGEKHPKAPQQVLHGRISRKAPIVQKVESQGSLLRSL